MENQKDSDEAELDQAELAVIERLRALVEMELNDLTPSNRQRILLGTASAFVDTVAEFATQDSPGVKVVELCLLGERLTHLACETPPSDKPLRQSEILTDDT